MHIHYCIYPNIPRLLRAVIEGPRVRAHLFGLDAMATSLPRRPMNYLFPKVKFLNHQTDLDFSYNQKLICQHILHHCNLAPSINKQAWWSHNSKLLMGALTSLRNNKTRSIRSLFYGMLFDERYLIQLCSYTFFVFVSRLVAYNR